MMEMTMLHKRIMTWGSVAASLTAIVVLASNVGVKLPKPAWSNDLFDLRQELSAGIKMAQSSSDNVMMRVLEVDRLTTEQALRTETQLYYDNLREQRTYERAVEPVPSELTREQVMLEAERRRLEQRLEDIVARERNLRLGN